MAIPPLAGAAAAVVPVVAAALLPAAVLEPVTVAALVMSVAPGVAAALSPFDEMVTMAEPALDVDCAGRAVVDPPEQATTVGRATLSARVIKAERIFMKGPKVEAERAVGSLGCVVARSILS